MEFLTPIVLITVFYETLCPDSRSFMDQQLLPVVEKLTKYVQVDLVPYGKATTIVTPEGYIKFKCQHGRTECLGNKIHACSLQEVSDVLTKVRLATCMINDNYNPERIGKLCCEKYGVDWDKVNRCAFGNEGSILLRKYGVQTSALNPPLTFVPTILLNQDRSRQAQILKNLFKEVCIKLRELEVYLDECEED